MTSINFFRRDLECRLALIDTFSDSVATFPGERGDEIGFVWYGDCVFNFRERWKDEIKIHELWEFTLFVVTREL